MNELKEPETLEEAVKMIAEIGGNGWRIQLQNALKGHYDAVFSWAECCLGIYDEDD